jgi:periplasmic divalent cation tolerance protein
MCVAKTSTLRYAELEESIRELHSYEEPEILATPIVAGGAGYLAWIGENLSP